MVKPAKRLALQDTLGARLKTMAARPNRHESVPVMVTLGSPKRNCAGQGICRVDGGLMSAEDLGARPCQAATAIADPIVGNQLRLHFVKASLCACAKRKHFGRASFQVDEPAPVGIAQWGVDGLRLQAGEYAIAESERYYTVCFYID